MAKKSPWKLQLGQIAKISPARGIALEGIGPGKHISFATLLLALVAFWGVIYIIDFRLLSPEKGGPVLLSHLYCLLHFWNNMHLLIFCMLRIQKIGIGYKIPKLGIYLYF